MSVQFADIDGVKSAIRDVRSDATPVDWMLIKYEGPKSQTLVLAGSGEGGINALAQHLAPDMVGYGLVRKTDRIDDSETVKFAFILFLGEKVGIMQKARISVHSGAVKDVVGQFHVDIATSSVDELTEEALVRKIQDTSGSGTRVLDDSGARRAPSGAASRPSVPRAAPSGSSDGVTLPLKEELQSVRSGKDNWVLFTLESNKLVLKAQGNGGTDELAEHLDDTAVAYGLVRLIERVDESDTVKFVFINWTGDNIPRMLRARLGTYSGAIKEYFHPYHVDIIATHRNEVTEAIVTDKVKRAAGTADHTREASSGASESSTRYVSNHQPPTSGTRAQNSVSATTKSQGIQIGGEEQVRGGIADVRNDTSTANWTLCTYDGPNSGTVIHLASGSGGVEELVSHLTPDMVGYGLVRCVEEFDLSQNVRFVFIDWVGENINRMLRAKLGTHSGAIKELFSPYHVDIHPTNHSEITQDIVTEKVRSNMGTSTRVRD